MAKLGQLIARATGHPLGLVAAIALSLLGWWALGVERTVLLVSLLTWWQLFPLQASQLRSEAEIKALLWEIAEDVPDVDEQRAAARART